MFNQHAKWLKVSRGLPWRQPIASFNYLLTSHVWRQDHNGFSHQDRLRRSGRQQRGWYRSCLLRTRRQHAALGHRSHLRTYDRINVIVANQLGPSPQWLTMKRLPRGDAGIGIWSWAGNEAHGTGWQSSWLAPEMSRRWSIRRGRLLRKGIARLENSRRQRRRSDDTAAQGSTSARHQRQRFRQHMFTRDRPVIFAYHGYPYLIHRLTYNRTNHAGNACSRLRGGTTTTPFDMVVLNELDRYHLAIDVIDRVQGLPSSAAHIKQQFRDKLLERTRDTSGSMARDMPEIQGWVWPYRNECQSRQLASRFLRKQPSVKPGTADVENNALPWTPAPPASSSACSTWPMPTPRICSQERDPRIPATSRTSRCRTCKAEASLTATGPHPGSRRTFWTISWSGPIRRQEAAASPRSVIASCTADRNLSRQRGWLARPSTNWHAWPRWRRCTRRRACRRHERCFRFDRIWFKSDVSIRRSMRRWSLRSAASQYLAVTRRAASAAMVSMAWVTNSLRKDCRKSRPISPANGLSLPISAAAPASARCAMAAASTPRWDWRRSTASWWARAAAPSIPACCSTCNASAACRRKNSSNYYITSPACWAFPASPARCASCCPVATHAPSRRSTCSLSKPPRLSAPWRSRCRGWIA